MRSIHSIRLRAGLVVAGAAVCGTVLMTTPTAALPDLAPYYTPPYWNDFIILRNDQTVTETSGVQEPGPLQYWPYASCNWGNFGTTGAAGAPRIAFYVSDEFQMAWWYYDVFPPGGTHHVHNVRPSQPPNLGSGLHTVRIFADYQEVVAESEEGNNQVARTFRWSGFPIPIGDEVQGNVPKRTPAYGGPYYDVHGVSGTTGSRYWYAFANMPRSYGDLDMRLYTVPPSNVPAQGFDTYVEWSANIGQGDLDFVVINRNLAPGGTYWGGVVSYEDELSVPTDVAFVEDQGLLSIGTNGPFSLDSAENLALHEFYNPFPGKRYRVRVEVLSGGADVGLTVFDGQHAYYAMNDGQSSDAAGAGEDEMLIFDSPDQRYHGISVWKPNVVGSSESSQYNLIMDDLPNMTPTNPAGWWGPVVPRATTDGTPSSVALPPTLPGNTFDTSFNWATRNQGPVDVPMVTSALYVDDEPRWAFSVGVASETDALALNSPQGFNESFVRGGRHHIRSEADYYDDVSERYETDNTYVDWFIWSPLQLQPGVPLVRPMPPEHSPLGAGPWFSSDGFRTEELTSPTQDGWWSVVGVLPHVATDEYETHVTVASTGSRDGFGPPIIPGISPGGGPTFGVINRNETATTIVDIGVVEFARSGDFTIEQANSHFEGDVETLPYFASPATIDSSHVIAIHELHIPETLVNEPTTVTLQNVRGGADLAIAIFDDETVYGSNITSIFGADAGGPGAHESLTATFDTKGNYGIVVYKTRPEDLELAAFYRVVLGDVVVATEESTAAPFALRLGAPSPNPFRTATRLRYEVPVAGDVRVSVFDAAGRQVRRLIDASTGAGRFDVEWDGRDEGGRAVTAGVYFVDLRSDAGHTSRRVVRVE